MELVSAAKYKELDAVAVTDHDTFEGSIRAARVAKDVGIIVVYGCEVRTELGDVLVLADHPFEAPKTLSLLIDKARDENALVIPAHPFDAFRKGIGEAIYDYKFDAVEVFNAASPPWCNRRALEVAKELGLPGLANSDAHTEEYLGVAYNIIDCNGSLEDLLEAIRKGRVHPVPGRPGPVDYARSMVKKAARKLSKLW